MRMPNQAPAVIRSAGAMPLAGMVEPAGCRLGKKIACAAAVAACVGTCAAGPQACIACFAALGAGSCIECL